MKKDGRNGETRNEIESAEREAAFWLARRNAFLNQRYGEDLSKVRPTKSTNLCSEQGLPYVHGRHFYQDYGIAIDRANSYDFIYIAMQFPKFRAKFEVKKFNFSKR